MELFSLKFILFLLFALTMYYTVYRFAPAKQWMVLLAVSMLFYSWSGIRNIMFIFTTAFSIFLGGGVIQKYTSSYAYAKKDKKLSRDDLIKLKHELTIKKRFILYTVLLINFGILSYIKYWNTISIGFSSLLYNKETVSTGAAAARILIPLGLSFYIFQSVSYVIDVYNGKYKAETNFFKFLLFVSFFPQLIQGPINRYNTLSTDLYTPHSFDWERTKHGLFTILFGLMKKYAIANLLAGSVANILDSPQPNMPGSVIAFGIFLYSVQMYADFSGGIDMVIGVAELFGVKMMQNFRQPYFSVSLGDFWRRWHISLGAWMRDYVFYPFALTKSMQKFSKKAVRIFGNQFGRIIPIGFANILVFLLVGIWHGAELHFIAWGLYNGIVIALGDVLAPAFKKLSCILHINTKTKAFHVFRIIRTFAIVSIGRYFDRIECISDCVMCLKNTILRFNGTFFVPVLLQKHNYDFPRTGFILAILSLIIVSIHSILAEDKKELYAVLQKKNVFVRWSMYYCMIFLVLASFMIPSQGGGFLYANF